MLIIPAVDLRNGRVVRLTQGVFENETVYSAAPEEVVLKWQVEGAKMIHVVDLDGALHGHRRNLGSLKNILSVSTIPVQFGGGLRTYEAIEEVLAVGVSRAVIGTKALDLDFVKRLIKHFHNQIVVSLDVRDNIIQTHGWQIGEIDYSLGTLLKSLEDAGVKNLICTDISRDGMLNGPNIDLLNYLLQNTKMDVIFSGGISDISHLAELAEIKSNHFKGAIVGKALYEKKFSLHEAIQQLQKEKK
jgi:phosphoribosylformimino-5-aminoimidazole carboxamide ribotide isomerase